MKTIRTTRRIEAPVELVFQTISDVRNFSKAVPDIKNVEFLTKQNSGAGTRFRETRVMNGREATVELEVAEFVENDRVRMVSDAGGTVWDTLFTVKEHGAVTVMEMAMDVKPYKFMAKLMTPLILGMVRKGVEGDMDAVKAYCEKVN